MARAQIGTLAGVAAVNVGGGTAGNRSNLNGSGAGTDASAGHHDADYNNITALRARLAVINAGVYTSAYLDQMTMNDMVYAVRLNDSPDTVIDR